MKTDGRTPWRAAGIAALALAVALGAVSPAGASLEGSKLKDPGAFARSVAKLMTGSAKSKEAA